MLEVAVLVRGVSCVLWSLLLKAKKWLWLIYDLLTLSKTEIMFSQAKGKKNKSKNKSDLDAVWSFPAHTTLRNYREEDRKIFTHRWPVLWFFSLRENCARMQIPTINLEFLNYEQCF